MPKSPKIIHPCNHVVTSKVRKYGEIPMVRSDSYNLYDSVPRNIQIIRIDSIKSPEGKVYKRGYHYTQSISQDVIEWINNNETPKSGESYVIWASYIYITSVKYPAEDCLRCNGNGWYSSIVNPNGQMDFVEGAQKLIQDFVKLLNTEKDGEYGSTIKDTLGKNVYSEVDINNAISASIAGCQEYLISKQNEEMANGVELDDSEILDSIEVRQVYFAQKETAYVISLVIYNKENRAIKFNFKI